MSLLPALFSDWWEDLDRPHQLLGQHFGLPIDPDTLFAEAFEPARTDVLLYRPPMSRRSKRRYHPFSGALARKSSRGTSTVAADKDKFLVTLDVQQFAPNEITVKVVDKSVIVEAKHDEKEDEHGWISRQFIRRYAIPEQCDIERVESSLSSDGILRITAPRKESPKTVANERPIKVQYTGRPAIDTYTESATSSSTATSMDTTTSNAEPTEERSKEQQQQQQQPQRQQQGQRGKKGAGKAA
ncbi:hypothetical protein KPH14_002854 [Odynerus spinipes]|uniref:SHSP domain-containing protein n=1 Tax=Odynerus spinipes TaxID=1348599 RepID=A0AAD9RWT7_9HYME|nr:hypothetical protein KPH14_002854 [Odynerus spinipes]